MKEFVLQAKDIFDKQDGAKLKGQKRFKDVGDYLANNEFGVAVIEVSTGTAGDSDKDAVLAQGRALVVHDYLAQHFSFDDTNLKTVAIGKQQGGEQTKDNWGEVRILIYPEGTAVPAAKTDSAPAAK